MMQAADLRSRNDLSLTWRLYFARRRRIAIQRQVRAYVVIICKIQSQNSLQMNFVQYDQVIQTFSTDGADESFSVGILPGRSWRSGDFVDSHAFDAVLEVVAVDAVAIAREKTWCFLVREGVDDLLRSPLGIGIRCYVKMNDSSPIVPKHNENVQHPKRSLRHGQEIAGDDVRNVIVEESSPGLRRRLTDANHVLGHRPLGDLMSQQ